MNSIRACLFENKDSWVGPQVIELGHEYAELELYTPYVTLWEINTNNRRHHISVWFYGEQLLFNLNNHAEYAR